MLRAEDLVRILGSDRVKGYEKWAGYLVLVPADEIGRVTVRRRRLTIFSTEPVWEFVAVVEGGNFEEASAAIKVEGLLRRRLKWKVEGPGGKALNEALRGVLGEGRLKSIIVKAKPDHLTVRVGEKVIVSAAKMIVGPHAGALRWVYDAVIGLARALAERS